MPVIPAPSPHQPKRALRLSPLQPKEPTPEAVQVAHSINKIIAQTRNPFGEPRPIDRQQARELESALRDLETQLAQREQAIQVLELKLAEKERDLWEAEALFKAREDVFQAERRRTTAPFTGAAAAAAAAVAAADETRALEKLKQEIEAQETALQDAKNQLREREQFLEDAETQLMSKMAAQQETETELEQREEDLRHRENKFRAAAGLPPIEEKKEPMEKA